MRTTVFAVAILIAIAGQSAAQDHRSAFKAIRALEATKPTAAFNEMQVIAQAGYAPALDRVGYYFRHGIGTQEDLDSARHWYIRAVSAGHPWSTASLARVEIALGHRDAAYQLLLAAVPEHRPGTERLFATAHIDGQLGTASDPDLGRTMLERLVADGDKNAARDLAVRSNWGRLNGNISDKAVALIVQAGLAGDARFAEAALIYLSRHGGTQKEPLETRMLLSKIPGIRDKILSVELIRLAADKSPTQFWSRVEEVLDNTEPQNYAQAASTAFWIDKNAWVRVLQKELRSFGYYTGKINGLMTTRTIRAQNRFCRDIGIWNTCATGPLRGPTVKAVAEAIANRG